MKSLLICSVSAALATLALLAGCGRGTTPGAEDAVSATGRVLFVSIAPQREAAARIAGDKWQVEVLVPPGASPESYSPDAATLNRLAGAAALFTLGVPMEEALLPKVAQLNPKLRIVDGTAGMTLEEFQGDDGQGPDPHSWLAIPNLRSFAATMAEELGRLDPEEAAGYRARAAEYDGALDRLDQEIAARLAPLRGHRVLVFHPAFGYFLRRYGLRQLSVEQEGKEPTGGHLAQLLEVARAEGLPAVFLQPQCNRRPAEALARELGCPVVTLDPLPGEYLEGLAEICRRIGAAYGLTEAAGTPEAPGGGKRP